jgi:hypothetical protein
MLGESAQLSWMSAKRAGMAAESMVTGDDRRVGLADLVDRGVGSRNEAIQGR